MTSDSHTGHWRCRWYRIRDCSTLSCAREEDYHLWSNRIEVEGCYPEAERSILLRARHRRYPCNPSFCQQDHQGTSRSRLPDQQCRCSTATQRERYESRGIPRKGRSRDCNQHSRSNAPGRQPAPTLPPEAWRCDHERIVSLRLHSCLDHQPSLQRHQGMAAFLEHEPAYAARTSWR